MTYASITLLAASMVSLLAVFITIRQNRRLIRKLKVCEVGLYEARQDIAALCAGAAGNGQRVNRVEQRLRRYAERQEAIESTQGRERPYGRAIQMVHNGASVDDLVANCGLTRNEAELLTMLHRVDMAV